VSKKYALHGDAYKRPYVTIGGYNPSVNSRRMQNLNALFGVAYRERR
jgi:hypothetical protein